jgi:MFS family permease
LAATLYTYAFLDDFVLLYPVYALLFTDHGISAWQLSSLFVIWSATGIVLEVPAGVLADMYSRRALLVIGPLLTAVGYALWVFAPSYPIFALGFVLWGAQGALASGALEALVYEALESDGAADRYAKITGRSHFAGVVGVMLATVVATPVLSRGGYPLAGLASVAACLLTAVAAATFPSSSSDADGHAGAAAADSDADSAAADADADADDVGYVATLRAGLAEARANTAVRPWLLLVPAITAIWGALEEYDPLLIRDAGVATAHVPLWNVLITAGISLGGLFATAANRLSQRGLGLLIAVATVAMAAGALSGHAAGLIPVAAAYGIFQMATVVADTRLQEHITGAGRATVTSVAALGTDALTIVVYGAYAALAPAGVGATFAILALPYLVVAVTLTKRRRRTSAQ